MSLHKRLLAALVAAATVIPLLVIASQPAVAQTSWPIEVSDVRPSEALTGLDGSYTALRCSTANVAYAAKTVSADGNVTAEIPVPQEYRTYLNFCSDAKAIDANGVLYGLRSNLETNDNRMVAYDGDTLLWSEVLTDPIACSGGPVKLGATRMVLGADGFLYARTIGVDVCKSNRYLTKIDASNGSVVSSVLLGTREVNWIQAYNDGIVLLYDSSKTLRYFPYSGGELPAVALEALPSRHSHQVAAATAAGRVYFKFTNGNVSGCASSSSTVKLTAYEPAGKVFDYDLPACASVHSVAANHDNVAAITMWIDRYTAKFVKVAGDETVIEDATLSEQEGVYDFASTYPSSDSVFADTNGNFLLVRKFERDDTYRSGTRFILSEGSSDVVRAAMSTDSIDSTRTLSVDRGALGMINGRLYVTATVCNSSVCSASNARFVYPVEFAELGMDYPRGTLLGVQPQDVMLDYVALGDSFSSGEGVEPFTPPSDTNGCHRSELAYPVSLNNAAATSLNLKEFVACSGATTDAVRVGMNTEPGQLDALSSGVDVITISVGGNDVDFANGMIACTLTNDAQVCENTLSVISGNVHSSWFRQRIESLYAEINTKAPNADVYVVGYPLFMGLPGQPHCDWYLRTMTSIEENLVDDIGTTLNAVIEDEATQAGFVFVPLAEAFGEHTACSSEPFVNGVDLINEGYSYHPNADGMNKISEEVLASMP